MRRFVSRIGSSGCVMPRWAPRSRSEPSSSSRRRLFAAICVSRGDSVFAEHLSEFQGLPKHDTRSIEHQLPLESCGLEGVYTRLPTLETQIDVPEERHQPLEMQIAQFCRNMSAIERLASRLHNRDLLNRDYAKDLCRCEEYVMPRRFLVTSISDSSSAAAALWPYDSGWAEAGIVCLTGRRAYPW